MRLKIGAMTRQRQVELDPRVAERAPMLGVALPKVAHPQIRSRGTLGGSIAHADPSGELVALSVALDSRLRLRSKQRGEIRRQRRLAHERLTRLRVIEAELFGLKAGRLTRGHRIHAPGPHEVASASAYERVLEDACVLADPDRRIAESDLLLDDELKVLTLKAKVARAEGREQEAARPADHLVDGAEDKAASRRVEFRVVTIS